MVLFVIAASYDLCTTLRAVFEPVALIHKQSVHAQLLKGDNIIFFALVIQTFQPCLQ